MTLQSFVVEEERSSESRNIWQRIVLPTNWQIRRASSPVETHRVAQSVTKMPEKATIESEIRRLKGIFEEQIAILKNEEDKDSRFRNLWVYQASVAELLRIDSDPRNRALQERLKTENETSLNARAGFLLQEGIVGSELILRNAFEACKRYDPTGKLGSNFAEPLPKTQNPSQDPLDIVLGPPSKPFEPRLSVAQAARHFAYFGLQIGVALHRLFPSETERTSENFNKLFSELAKVVQHPVSTLKF